MKKTCTAVWNAIIKECAIMMEKDKNLVMYKDSEQLFSQNFEYYHNLILDKFMRLPDEHLDRHKIAAIIICSILKSNILGITLESKHSQTIDGVFLANEKIALNIALSYMYKELTAEFKVGKIPFNSMFSDYVFPRPLSCDREYTEVICRDLYFAKRYFELNPLSIANFLFLLEEYSFEASGIKINVQNWKNLSKSRQKEQWREELKYIELSLSKLDEKMSHEQQRLKRKKNDLQSKLQQNSSVD